jgi:hypothetical protein
MRFSVFIGLLVAVSAAMSLTAWAGPSTSGGGFAVVCRNSVDKIESAELLDLYEARTVYNFELMKSSGDEQRDYVRAVSNGYRLRGSNPPVTEHEILEHLQRFRKLIAWLPEDEKLPNLHDLGSTINIPSGCKIEPLAVFYDSQDVVLIDKEIWTALDSLSRSALVLHEVNYHYFRHLEINPDVDSLDARVFSASNFSTNLVPVQSGIPANSQIRQIWGDCHTFDEGSTTCTESTTYHIFSNGQDSPDKRNLRVQFTFLAGRPLLSQTTVDLPRWVNPGDTFEINSRQLKGWTAEVIADKTRFDGTGVKLLIKRGQSIMVEIAL